MKTESPTAAVRHFNRFYTQRIGVLNRGLSSSPFSLTEARILYELAQHAETTATELTAMLDIDAGYLSRIVSRFDEAGFLRKRRSEDDGRQWILEITPAGKQQFDELNLGTEREIGEMISGLGDEKCRRLVAAMDTIESLLVPAAGPRASFVLRTHQPGDIGHVIGRHGVVYGEEYGWGERFEGFVAEGMGEFLRNFDPERERSWIAECGSEIVGSVFISDEGDGVARLRCLLVEPSARGSGLGEKLVSECVRFCRRKRYRKIILWTTSILTAARRLYERQGFVLVEEEPLPDFGENLIGERWELDVGSA